MDSKKNMEVFCSFCLKKGGTTESIPFSKPPELLVFKVRNNMFLAVQELSCFSKKCWGTAILEGSVSDTQRRECRDISYQLVVQGLPLKRPALLFNHYCNATIFH
jgi:predicted DNA-binding protein (MmcQ/YjbR family)